MFTLIFYMKIFVLENNQKRRYLWIIIVVKWTVCTNEKIWSSHYGATYIKFKKTYIYFSMEKLFVYPFALKCCEFSVIVQSF